MASIALPLGGISAGIITVVNQVYIAELASPRHRGSLGVLPTCFGLAGTLLCFSLSYGVSWSNISIAGAAMNGPYLLLLLFYLPDSPRYLLRQGKVPSAAAGLKRLGTLDQLSDMRDAYDLLKLSGHDGGLLKKPFMLPVIIAGGLMFFSQFSGVDSVLTYAAQQFRDKTNFPLVILYGVQLITALICFGSVDRKGRKWLLLVSAAAAALAMLSLGLYVLCEDIGLLGQMDLRWIPISCVIVYCGAFALGLGPIPWLILGELLPVRSQGTAAAITAGLFWGPSLVVTMSFGDMQNAMYLSGTFWFYTIFCLFGYLFVLLVVPDIRPEATLEQIQIFFMASDKREHDQWSFAAAWNSPLLPTRLFNNPSPQLSPVTKDSRSHHRPSCLYIYTLRIHNFYPLFGKIIKISLYLALAVLLYSSNTCISLIRNCVSRLCVCVCVCACQMVTCENRAINKIDYIDSSAVVLRTSFKGVDDNCSGYYTTADCRDRHPNRSIKHRR